MAGSIGRCTEAGRSWVRYRCRGSTAGIWLNVRWAETIAKYRGRVWTASLDFGRLAQRELGELKSIGNGEEAVGVQVLLPIHPHRR